MKVLSQFAESKELQDKGTPFKLGNEEDTIIYVRRANHKWDEALIDCKRFLFGVYYNEATLTPEERQKAVALTIAEYLVAGWENLIDDSTGKQINYTMSASKSVFCNEEMYLSLNMFILGHANNYENYLYTKLEEDKESAKK